MKDNVMGISIRPFFMEKSSQFVNEGNELLFQAPSLKFCGRGWEGCKVLKAGSAEAKVLDAQYRKVRTVTVDMRTPSLFRIGKANPENKVELTIYYSGLMSDGARDARSVIDEFMGDGTDVRKERYLHHVLRETFKAEEAMAASTEADQRR